MDVNTGIALVTLGLGAFVIYEISTGDLLGTVEKTVDQGAKDAIKLIPDLTEQLSKAEHSLIPGGEIESQFEGQAEQFVSEFFGDGNAAIGEACLHNNDCSRNGMSNSGLKAGLLSNVSCCAQKCQFKRPDWAGVSYCPFECVGTFTGNRGSCTKKSQAEKNYEEMMIVGVDQTIDDLDQDDDHEELMNHEIDYMDTIEEDHDAVIHTNESMVGMYCGNKRRGSKTNKNLCCNTKTQLWDTKKRDWAGNMYCPDICKNNIFGKVGTC